MSAEPRLLATGLRFPEGPTLLDDGAVAVVEMRGEAVARVAADGAVTRLGDCGGGPNGSALGSDGAVYVANNGGLALGPEGIVHAEREFDGRVQRVDADGTVTTVADGLPGPGPHRPNDICFAPDGRLLVTDSANWSEPRDLKPGRLLAIAADGAVSVLAEIEGVPNGLAFSPDDATLYLAQSMTRKILAFEVRADGGLGEPATWGKLPGGMPDGMCVGADGALYVCGSIDDSLHVFRDGELAETFELPKNSQPTNCCLTEEGDLLVTLAKTGELIALGVGAERLPLHRGSITNGAAA
ncbi:MAG: SMP-30/gluconolactonase/LRE family protein [Solirubrobacterales bacterium]